jgi:hypothetical protein
VFHQLKFSNNEISREEKMRNWELSSNTVCKEVDDASDDGEAELPIEFSDAKEFLISSQPFQHLIERFRALYYDRDEMLLTIRNLMISTSAMFPLGHDYSKATFRMNWDIPAFMKTQYEFDSNVKLASVITISGSALYCQATTSGEYLRQTWPDHGAQMLEVLQAALDSPELSAQGMEPAISF